MIHRNGVAQHPLLRHNTNEMKLFITHTAKHFDHRLCLMKCSPAVPPNVASFVTGLSDLLDISMIVARTVKSCEQTERGEVDPKLERL